MNEYIFYTSEGHTCAPNEYYEVDNCQVIGKVFGRTQDDALKNLLKDNDWIDKANFNHQEFVGKQILTEELRNDIKVLVDYLNSSRGRYFKECIEKGNNISSVIKRLKLI